jgi:hypothetical protein
VLAHLDQLTRIFAAVPDGSITIQNTHVAKACVKAGLGVILLKPGSKEPACTLTTAQAKQADVFAIKSGLRRHACGVKHVITELRELNHKRPKELLSAGCNLGIVPGAGETRVIIIDVDTEEEKAAFLRDWAKHTTTGTPPSLTVTSPGSWARDRGGYVMNGDEHVWAHRGGGHFWLTTDQALPEEGSGKYRSPSGWTAMFRDCYVLIPPSVRSEGPYRCTGTTQAAPSWLLEAISAHATAPKRSWRSGDLGDAGPLDAWCEEHPGSSIAISHGYTAASHDMCGCPTWTRPGDASHPKSITTCEPGCSKFDTSRGWGPVHIWSDAIEGFAGGETITPLQFLARMDYGGDVRAAMDGEEIPVSAGSPEDYEDPGNELIAQMMGDTGPKASRP